jgi:hypothetical protein
MTEDEVRAVQARAKGCLNDENGRGLDVGNPSHFVLLVNRTRSELAGVAEDDLRVVVAMCWLGPQSAGIPPVAMCHDLLGILRRWIPDERVRLERIMEFAIAYGCGKWREIQAGCGGWEHRWQGAMRGLVRALEPAVAQANRWLAEHVVGFPQYRGIPRDKDFPEDTAVWSDAWMLATRLVRPEHLFHLEEKETLTITCMPEGTECTTAARDYRQTILPGAKALWTVREGEGVLILPGRRFFTLETGITALIIARDEDTLIKTTGNGQNQQARLKAEEEANVQGPTMLAIWECTCGTTHCIERHRLHTWDPTQRVQKAGTQDEQKKKEETPLTLWDFVASAVKGPQPRIQTGSFVQGIYFPLLAQEGCES